MNVLNSAHVNTDIIIYNSRNYINVLDVPKIFGTGGSTIVEII